MLKCHYLYITKLKFIALKFKLRVIALLNFKD